MDWIKCEDRLPEDNQRVLIKLNPEQEVNPFWYKYYTTTYSAMWDKSIQKAKYFFVEDGCGGSRFDTSIVLGWMPIEELEAIETVVHCKDCKYFQEKLHVCSINKIGEIRPVRSPDDFCSHGKKNIF